MVKKYLAAKIPFKWKGKSAFSSFNATCIGASHLKEKKTCQDNSANLSLPAFSIIAVADGHGGEEYFRSDRGARFAVESAMKCIERFLLINDNLLNNTDESLKALEASILISWHEKILNDIKKNPVKFEQKRRDFFSPYGTTLIAAALTRFNWFAIQIGDGKCVVINNDKSVSQPVPWDERCFLNRTTSLCDEYAGGNFRHFYSKEKPLAIFLGSDGIDDTFPVNKNEEHLASFYQSVYENFKKEGFKKGEKQLRKMLPLFTQKGSGDDVSIAGIISRM